MLRRCHYGNLNKPSERTVRRRIERISIQMLPAPDIRRFYRIMFDKIRALGGNDRILHNPTPLEDSVIKALTHYKVKMLIIDEIHNVLAGRNDKQHEFLNALRYLGNALKIPMFVLEQRMPILRYAAMRNWRTDLNHFCFLHGKQAKSMIRS